MGGRVDVTVSLPDGKLPDKRLQYCDAPPPEFGSLEYIAAFGPITPEQGQAYKAHMCCD